MSEYKIDAKPGTHEIVITHVYDAPLELVFNAYADPKLVDQWWGPATLTTVIDRMEIRPGGSWRVVQRDPNGKEYAFRGVYHDVTPPLRVVRTMEWEELPGHVLLETATFEESEGKTIVRDQMVFQSVEDRDGMLESGMREGVAAGHERFASLLKRVQSRKAA